MNFTIVSKFLKSYPFITTAISNATKNITDKSTIVNWNLYDISANTGGWQNNYVVNTSGDIQQHCFEDSYVRYAFQLDIA